MIVDGREIAKDRIAHMRAFVSEGGIHPSLTAFTMEPTKATLQYLRMKTHVAESIGIEMRVVTVEPGTTTEAFIARVAEESARADGLVIQLPFPKSIDMNAVLEMLPEALDPDRMGKAARAEGVRPRVLAPVVSAMRLLLGREGIAVAHTHAVVVGQGRLVGAPSAAWLLKEGARVTKFTRDAGIEPHVMRTADIIVLGAGVPGLLTPGMIKEGVVIFDAGTSEEGGRALGDADPRCAELARLFTPVPGGIGPIAVAELFANMLQLRFDYQ